MCSCIYKLFHLGYGFVEYEDPRDAEDAIKYCDGMRFLGGRMVVEFAKGPGRRGERSSNDECFRCGKVGHWARDCPSSSDRGGYRRDDRHRRDDRDDRYRRDDRDDRYRRDDRDERRRSPSRSRSPAKSRSRSPARRSPSRSPR